MPKRSVRLPKKAPKKVSPSAQKVPKKVSPVAQKATQKVTQKVTRKVNMTAQKGTQKVMGCIYIVKTQSVCMTCCFYSLHFFVYPSFCFLYVFVLFTLWCDVLFHLVKLRTPERGPQARYQSVDPKPDARAWIPERGTLNRIK
jgi:hypothetical protein